MSESPKPPSPQVQLFRLSVENRKLAAELHRTNQELSTWKSRAERAQAIAAALLTQKKGNA